MADDENLGQNNNPDFDPDKADAPGSIVSADDVAANAADDEIQIREEASATAKPKRKRPKLIKASTAVKRLEKLYGGSANAKQLISDKIEDGEIRAYAYRYWTSTSWKRSKAWGDAPPEDAVRKKRIKRSTWAASSLIKKDMAVWNWEKGKFIVSHKKPKRKILRHMYLDVRVAAPDIETLKEAARAPVATPHAGGRKFNEIEWSKVWMAVIAIIQEASVKQIAFSGEKEFVGAVYQRYEEVKGPTGLEEDTIRRALNQAYRDLLAKGYITGKTRKSGKAVGA
ncbi:MAG: hypothetical protein HEQ21_07620 [Blastomonas sp.]|uniref:hypothetical protein n=1 Tax=Blastomonas sp. TaxID=1909299 RepID=UPI002586E3C9|nr:hypothetical protein [Blastomonas sp.]MCO5792672.1 hypothetical protein [Blastomonas sp.]